MSADAPFELKKVINSMGDCLAAEQSTNDSVYNIVRAVQLLLTLIINWLLVKIVLCYKRSLITLHANLLILVISVLVCYAFFSWSFIIMNIRNFYLALTYSDPCDCLSPVWLVYVVRMPFYMYIAGSPMLHFAIMVERVRATLFVHNYESAGTKFAVGIFLIVKMLTLSFCAYVYITSKMDAQLTGKPMVYFTLTSSNFNAVQLIYVHYFFLFLVICISIADYFLIKMNSDLKRKFSNKVQDYSLSRNYQTNENILTMRIIFPLDFSYTVVFSVFNLLSYYIRSKREEVGQIAYMKTYDMFIVLLLAHAIFTLIVYQFFVNRKAKMQRKFGFLNVNEQTNAHFDQLEKQWK